MTKIMTCNKDNHFTWGDQCMGWHLSDNHELSVIKEIMPPNTKESKHYHVKSRQVFYIIEGKAEFDVEGEKYIVDSDQAITIGEGKQHFVMNNCHHHLIFLVISSPSTVNDRINISD